MRMACYEVEIGREDEVGIPEDIIGAMSTCSDSAGVPPEPRKVCFRGEYFEVHRRYAVKLAPEAEYFLPPNPGIGRCLRGRFASCRISQERHHL
ncbi:hypothetical protein ABM06_17290 [Xanthomonas oryzae pv. oryzae]|nr:hypothetical protein ATY47_17255 [Xanthomonas oryzae pv. oryzae]AOS32615.1 hypothetical protein ATY49_17115 [Xanthomonas oryzae pv. oryzae]AQU46465.1 hypothetical protein ABM06_17290 [Xanthomonas oryzae pv. oryzae]